MSLKAVQLKIGYRSDEDNLIDDLYVPCLSQSVEYSRAVGYFTSASLALAAKGLYALVANGGSMRLVASPALLPEDIEAIVRGYAAREDIIERALLRNFNPEVLREVPEADRNRLECLAWLVAEGRLEIRIASPADPSRRGLYHEKMGLFRDADGNQVAFAGSPNETAGGLVSNFESVDVYWSWSDPDGRVARKVTQFERLWKNLTPGLEIQMFPEALTRVLSSLKRGEYRPQTDPGSRHAVSQTRGVELRPYQELAIAAWFRAGCQGILAMATGSGKTITALAAIDRWVQTRQRGVIMISCPYQHLVQQWNEEAQRFSLKPILAFQSSVSWGRALARELVDYQFGVKALVCVITTHSTLRGATMQRFISQLDEPILFVADEAHHLGAVDLRTKLPVLAAGRLGLSATPERWMDLEGTAAVEEFFGQVVFEYSLDQAIRDGRLTPYYYYPHLVQLTDDEQHRYVALTTRIARLLYKLNGAEAEAQLERVLRERTNVMNAAANKLEVLRRLVEPQCNELSHALFYCSPQNIDAVLDLLKTHLGMRVHRFTAEESIKDRTSLLADLDSGAIQGLVAIRCLDEGVDVPSVRMAFILASSSNPREFIQRRGRLLRLAHGKEAAVIHDLMTVPVSGEDQKTFETERRLVRRELARFKEFASSALNFFEANEVVLPIARQYHLMDF